ncbi:MAG: HNH endonuclease signature motif containing protein [Geminicoccaceae bacterium]
MARPIEPVVSRFWKYVEQGHPDECWNWKGGRLGRLYGAFNYPGNKPGYAHRFSYELHHGKIPAGSIVMHTCDRPACVNPMHLTLGTQKENIRDSVRKGRWMTDKRKDHIRKMNELNAADLRAEEL